MDIQHVMLDIIVVYIQSRRRFMIIDLFDTDIQHVWFEIIVLVRQRSIDHLEIIFRVYGANLIKHYTFPKMHKILTIK
jgi:hypothetical protein